jgi:hypothetical protein
MSPSVNMTRTYLPIDIGTTSSGTHRLLFIGWQRCAIIDSN